jgi:hypothetical protein
MIIRKLVVLTWLLLTVAPFAPSQAAEAPALPAVLELSYTLRYGALTVGRVVKTLKRDVDGNFQHRSHSTPLGMAKMFTGVEWFEEGKFEIQQNKIRPLSFLEYRVGADKSHRHSARFDWKAMQIFYENWPTTPLPPGTQDQGSFLFALMLNPPVPGAQQTIHVSSGKKLRVYRYGHAGSEILKTTLGTLKTTIVERLATEGKTEGLRVWLAKERGNLPVRISTTQRGQDTTLELESVRGL